LTLTGRRRRPVRPVVATRKGSAAPLQSTPPPSPAHTPGSTPNHRNATPVPAPDHDVRRGWSGTKGSIVNKHRIRGPVQRVARYKYSLGTAKAAAAARLGATTSSPAMGSSRRDGRLELRLVHRLLALASLLLLASGEVIFEERFEGTSLTASDQFPASV
jgi:hypothetical protein